MQQQTASVGATLKDFIMLTKPGIIRTNLFAAFGGFWLASQWDIDWLRLLYVLLGSTLVMASSCVFNNYLDRDMDALMERTSARALPTGRIKPSYVFLYGAVLGLAGLAVLQWLVNPLSAVLGAVGMFVYVVIYTMWLKRTSTWSTSIGGISGAMPPIIGYAAVTGKMDAGFWILFAILFLWQPPHFWSLGIRRKEEYRAAGFPLLPVVKGVKRTKLQMIPYLVVLVPVSTLLTFYNYTGMIYLVCSVLLGVVWLIHTLRGMKAADDDRWAKQNFILSINYLTVLFLVMILNTSHS